MKDSKRATTASKSAPAPKISTKVDEFLTELGRTPNGEPLRRSSIVITLIERVSVDVDDDDDATFAVNTGLLEFIVVVVWGDQRIADGKLLSF